MPLSLAQMRRNYCRDGLSDEAAPDDPLSLFQQWLQQARDTEQAPVEANSMCLATVDEQGQPHCRVLLLKGLSAEGFTFFGNYQSAKGLELAANPRAAMTFFWPALERQVRIEGLVSRLAPRLSDVYFDSRSLASRLGAWASPQSQPLANRLQLESLLASTTSRFDGQPVPRPEHWGGYCLRPQRMEFWQGRSDRLHDRLDYRLHEGAWRHGRLAP
ncbi:pyridoxamine 5'-phosphate oxidase [Pseudomonas chlororaphis]|uniref:Pyridoxine/pyridoxamine 5'-phosphate oxidase n=2 Tax=Pseudomonas chlororaphis TaxID=587753 RepID=A0AAP9VQ07_9PSED|nr:pyridoxamine 5'-phosphate oxidase [Pseudomonas chlororaphis]AUG41570.1 pyridoxamine 5'-phosphate oxidase [Pseudomonas chlororaphis]AZE30366.1 Pyridoxamine 5'-phosphate oxidase [Pseudomonas chlororaphis subsp. aureofaciens]AZE36694.1 Pyridoxamine 5'-phosphate oxidase [Pseudomonas chlororaphis subsp. aureofaciens]AZE42999.1 Pyridoxamine 5'-phosphate oxidase [Pseudomonas chlororaphis subsp. aureofaciens]KAA5842063.1 pyridoxamine 5'-phosphate oxidase [Pseudomonas chlororaphis]